MDPLFPHDLGRRPARRAMLGRLLRPLGAALAMGLLLPVMPVQAARPVTIHAVIGSCQVSGESRLSGPLTVKLWSAGMTLRSRMTVAVDDLSDWEGCLPLARVRGGDVIEVVRSRKLMASVTVPAFSAVVDRLTDVVTGEGPAGQRITVRVVDDQSVVRVARTVDVPAGGHWSLDVTSTYDLRGEDRVDLEWNGSNGSTVERRIHVPHLEVVMGRAGIHGAGAAGTNVKVELWSSKGVLRGVAIASTLPDGSFSAAFHNSGGAVAVKDGDVIVSPIAPDAVVPATMLLIPLVAPANRLMATCPGHARYRLVLTSPDGQTNEFWSGHASWKGKIVIDGIVSSHHGWKASMTCWTKAGDSVARSMTLP